MAESLQAPPRTWTVEDLDELPDGARYEIVDGQLLVSPWPAASHDLILDRLRYLLADAVSDRDRVVGPAGVSFGSDYRVPDLIVLAPGVDRDRRSLLTSAEVTLAIEIVSPSSRTTDRLLKPAQYAAARISGYWRVETDPALSVTAYALEPDAAVYRELGTWSVGMRVELLTPVPIAFKIDLLIH